MKPIGLVISAAMLPFYVLISTSVIAMEVGLDLNGFDPDPGKVFGFAAVLVMSAGMTLLLNRVLRKSG